MAWVFTRKVRYYETDRMGVVHHSNYLRFLEDARIDWLEENVMPYSEMERLGVIVPCVSASGSFLHYLKFGDTFSVHVRLVKYTGVQLGFSYEVYNDASGELCYAGETSHCFAADGDYHPISLRRKVPAAHENLLRLLETE